MPSLPMRKPIMGLVFLLLAAGPGRVHSGEGNRRRNGDAGTGGGDGVRQSHLRRLRHHPLRTLRRDQEPAQQEHRPGRSLARPLGRTSLLHLAF